MALVSRLTVLESKEPEPEDIMCAALAVIFPDDVMVQHGDPDHALEWRSPHLPPGKHLRITLADPPDRHDRYLFSHYLWNASLLVAEFVEAASLGVPLGMPSGVGRGSSSPRGKMIPGPPAASPRIGAEDEDEEEEERERQMEKLKERERNKKDIEERLKGLKRSESILSKCRLLFG